MPQAPEAKNNAAIRCMSFVSSLWVKTASGQKNTSNTRAYQTLGLPMATFALLQLQSPELGTKPLTNSHKY